MTKIWNWDTCLCSCLHVPQSRWCLSQWNHYEYSRLPQLATHPGRSPTVARMQNPNQTDSAIQSITTNKNALTYWFAARQVHELQLCFLRSTQGDATAVCPGVTRRDLRRPWRGCCGGSAVCTWVQCEWTFSAPFTHVFLAQVFTLHQLK